MEASADNQDFAMIMQYRESPGVDEAALGNRQILLDALDELLAGNEEAFWRIFDPDVTFHEAACLPYGGVHRGLEAARRAYEHMVSTYSGMRAVFEQVLTGGDQVILYQTITFRVAANGNTGTLPVSEMFRFRNGKVVEWRALYFDADMVARAIRGD